MNFRTSLFPVAALALAACVLPACQQNLAYINIPADHGDVAINDPNGSNVAHLEAISLKAVRKDASAKGPVTVLLPAGSHYTTYQRVVALAGDGFVLPDTAPAGTPVYEVRAIHTRNADGRVDVVVPGEIRPLSLIEVNLEFRAEIDGLGWRVTYLEPRRILPATADHQAPANPAVAAKAEVKEESKSEAKEEVKETPKIEPKAEPKAEPVPAKVKFQA